MLDSWVFWCLWVFLIKFGSWQDATATAVTKPSYFQCERWLWFNPIWQLSTTPWNGMAGRIGRTKRKLKGWEKDSLISRNKEQKPPAPKKPKMERVMQTRTIAALANFPSSFYCWAWCHIIRNVPSISWGSCPGWVSSQLLMYHQITHWRGGVMGKKALTLQALVSSY